MIMQNTQFLLVGLGLIGGSYAIALKKHGMQVAAIDTDQKAIDYALEKGIIDEGKTYPDEAIIKKADFVVFGLYPKTLVEWVKKHAHLLKSGAFLTDVSGVKCQIVDEIQGALRPDVEFFASHPMAGREVSGVQNSTDTMFTAANFILTPTDRNTKEGEQKLVNLAQILGFKHVTTLSPSEHDKMVGFVSQLTHVIAVSLMNCKDNPSLCEYTGDSFRDLTRIANINEALWSELFLLNRDILLEEIDHFVQEVEHLKETLSRGDEQGLKELFIQSTQRRKVFDKPI